MHRGEPAISPEEISLRALYQALSARDIDSVLSCLAPDVRWPRGGQGGPRKGREAVRRHWLRQWATAELVITPTNFAQLADGAISVTALQTMWDIGGTLMSNRMVGHTYRFRDGLVTSMTVDEPL